MTHSQSFEPKARRIRKSRAQRTPEQLELRRMRKRWYGLSSIVGLVLLAISAHVIYTVQWNEYALEKYADEDLRNTVFALGHADRWLPFEQWVHPYNLGTVQSEQGAFKGAIARFEEAEGLAPKISPDTDYSMLSAQALPPMCKIRVNHAETYARIGEATYTQGTFLWDIVNAQFDSAFRAPTKDAYDGFLENAEEHRVPAHEQFMISLESFQKAADLLKEFQCSDPDRVEQLEKKANRSEKRAKASEKLNPPDWNPRPTSSSNNSDNDPADKPNVQPEPQDSPDPKPQDEPDEKDGKGAQNSQGSSNQNYSPDELARQSKLNERGRIGDIERQEADAFRNATTPGEKQW